MVGREKGMGREGRNMGNMEQDTHTRREKNGHDRRARSGRNKWI